MTNERAIELLNPLCEGLAMLPGGHVQDLIHRIRIANRDNIPELMPEVLQLARRGIDNIRGLAEYNADRLYDASEELEHELSNLRSSRERAEEVYAQLENLIRDALDILQNHLPVASTSPKALHFGQTVLLKLRNFRNTEEVIAKAQSDLCKSDNALISEIFEEVAEEAAEIVIAANRILGGMLEHPRKLIFRSPGFSPVRLFTVYDTYEFVRGLGQGAAVLKPLETLQKTALFVTKYLKIPVSLITAGFGMESLGHARQAAIRREVVNSAAEQMRRNLSAAMQQLHSFQRDVSRESRRCVAKYFEQQSSRCNQRLRELSSQRRSSHQNALKAERVMLSVERIAREILASSPLNLAAKEAR